MSVAESFFLPTEAIHSKKRWGLAQWSSPRFIYPLKLLTDVVIRYMPSTTANIFIHILSLSNLSRSYLGNFVTKIGKYEQARNLILCDNRTIDFFV